VADEQWPELGKATAVPKRPTNHAVPLLTMRRGSDQKIGSRNFSWTPLLTVSYLADWLRRQASGRTATFIPPLHVHSLTEIQRGEAKSMPQQKPCALLALELIGLADVRLLLPPH
jgi:hypothetical protein